MMRVVIAMAIFIGLIVIGTACSAAPAVLPTPLAEAVYQTMTIDEFAAALDQPGSYTVINVHIPYEGEVPNTDDQIPYDDINALTAALPDRNAAIILYCRSGRMSEEASRVLVGLGYTNLVDVPGGMNAWMASGRELLMSEIGS
ncbi:MAG: rhodanese-like domain-containing protein [Chloroflexota bacterium]|nr:rhodanese-like domain-containing protein [Chloroflexota bacterium]